jgi:hypothetical protein
LPAQRRVLRRQWQKLLLQYKRFGTLSTPEGRTLGFRLIS